MNNKYIKTYVSFLKRSIQIERPLKVIFDCSNGTTGIVLKRFKIKDLRFKIINSKPDGNFPAHGPDPLTKGASNQLKKAVLKYGADLGAIFDGDGDRVRFVDDKGRDVNPDIVARLLIWRLNAQKTVIDALTGWAVTKFQVSPKESEIPTGQANFKLQVIRSRVGHQSVSDAMRKRKADLGAEYSGHYYFPMRGPKLSIYYDDGILAAIEIINALSSIPFSMSQFADLTGKSFRETSAIRIAKGGKFNLREVENNLKTSAGGENHKLKAISHFDGLTVEAKNFWFNIRQSNTEPLIRLNIEANSPKILKKEKNKLTKLLKSAIFK